jgi:hypothetical protein
LEIQFSTRFEGKELGLHSSFMRCSICFSMR